MYLVTAATEFEMMPFLEASGSGDLARLVTGIGPVETAFSLTSWLYRNRKDVTGIINFGVAGAYIHPGGRENPGLLDICLAEREVFGDLGICLDGRIEPITGNGLNVPNVFDMDPELLAETRDILQDGQVPYRCGTFVTVSCATGTAERGTMLARQYEGLCENMEGASVARICAAFALPCLEIRCISNMVEDRDTSRWQLRQACRKSGRVTATVVHHLVRKLSGRPGSADT